VTRQVTFGPAPSTAAVPGIANVASSPAPGSVANSPAPGNVASNPAPTSVDSTPAPPSAASSPSVDSNPAPGKVVNSPSVASSLSVDSAPAPTTAGRFVLTLHTRDAGTLRAVVHPMTVPPGATTVTLPEPPGCPWISPSQVPYRRATLPAGCDWTDTSRWVRNAAYPSAPPAGVTYVYGHACRVHVCPFTPVRQTATGYTVRPGDTVTIDTGAALLTYRVCAVAASPKDGPARQPACTGRVDLDIVTCQYDARGASTENIVIAATLAAGKPGQSSTTPGT
jgi:hypothetical protein